jgi:hypothetical protein
MLRRILEVDPLACREWGSEMKIVSFIIDPPIIALWFVVRWRRSRFGVTTRARASSSVSEAKAANKYNPGMDTVKQMKLLGIAWRQFRQTTRHMDVFSGFVCSSHW